jgi:hypothetical protein
LVSARRFQLIGLFGSRSLECRKSERTSTGRPKRPAAIQRQASWPPGKKGISEEQRTSSSGWAATALMMAWLASRSMPKGFSPRRCLPASSAAV